MESPQDILEDRPTAFGLVMEDELLYTLLFWEEDLRIPEERSDLSKLAGTQLITVPQKLLILDRTRRVMACTGRKTIKTINLESKATQWALWNRREQGHDEALICTPGQTHLEPLMDRVYTRVNSTPLFSLFCLPQDQLRGEGVQRWKTGIFVYWRIEGMSGTDKNMAAVRAKWVLFDEGAFGNDICHGSRVQTALPGARWVYSGVPNFLRSPFRRIATEKLRGWSHHGGSTYKFNPLYWSQQARQELIDSYEGITDPLYQTQVLGLWTEQMGASAFPPGCFSFHDRPYLISHPQAQDIANSNWPKILGGFSPDYRHYVIGYDYGYSPEPAVIVVLGSNDLFNWYSCARFRYREVVLPDQIALIQTIAEKLLGKRALFISSDHRPAIQLLLRAMPWLRKPEFAPEEALDHATWAVPQGTIQRVDADGMPMLSNEGKPVVVRVREFLSDLIRDAMSYAQLMAPYYFYLHLSEEKDHELIDELGGTSSYRTAAGYMVYHSPKKTPGSRSDDDHNTDALRFACDAAYKVWLEGVEPEQASLEGLGVVKDAAMPGAEVRWEDMHQILWPPRGAY